MGLRLAHSLKESEVTKISQSERKTERLQKQCGQRERVTEYKEREREKGGTYTLHKLYVGEHEEVVVNVVDTSVGGSGLPDQGVHLSLYLVCLPHHPLTKLLQMKQHLQEQRNRSR